MKHDKEKLELPWVVLRGVCYHKTTDDDLGLVCTLNPLKRSDGKRHSFDVCDVSTCLFAKKFSTRESRELIEELVRMSMALMDELDRDTEKPSFEDERKVILEQTKAFRADK